jgi:hypothetical protein
MKLLSLLVLPILAASAAKIAVRQDECRGMYDYCTVHAGHGHIPGGKPACKTSLGE